MYTLYWSAECGSFAPHVALVEADAQFDLVEVDLGAHEHFNPAFLAINPRAQVPVLRSSDGTVLTESVAMMMHIADSHPRACLMPKIGESQRAIAYRWLVFCAVNLYEAGCRVSHPSNYTVDPSGYDGVQEKALNDLNQYWTMVVDAIDDGPFFFGDTYSAVDICLLMIAQWHPETKSLLERLPKLAELCRATRERPAVDQVWRLNFLNC